MKTLFVIVLLCLGINAEARIPRSQAAKWQFAKTHACPSTGLHRPSCPGYVIDHIIALDCGGRDRPGNFQWQTVAEGKTKDKWERIGCAHGKKVTP